MLVRLERFMVVIVGHQMAFASLKIKTHGYFNKYEPESAPD